MREQLDQLRPNLGDYEDVCRKFSWERAAKALAGLPRGGLNIAYEATDRHVVEGRGDRIALRWIAQDKATREFSYRDLATGSARFCNALDKLGIGSGDRVFTLLGRVPALYVTALGVWKRGAVLSPLFSAFGPEPIKARMTIAEPKALVTTHRFFERKVKPILGELPFLKTIILVGGGEGGEDFDAMLAEARETCEIAVTKPEDLALLHFTSGTTGKPEGRHARPRAPWSRITPPARLRARSASPTTSSGARPIPAGSPARPTASSRR